MAFTLFFKDHVIVLYVIIIMSHPWTNDGGTAAGHVACSLMGY